MDGQHGRNGNRRNRGRGRGGRNASEQRPSADRGPASSGANDALSERPLSRSAASHAEQPASEVRREMGVRSMERNETSGWGSYPPPTMAHQSSQLEAYRTGGLPQQQMGSAQVLDSEAAVGLIQNSSDDARMRELEGIVELVGRLQLQFGRVQQQLQHALDAPLAGAGDAGSASQPASAEFPSLSPEVVLQLNASVAATLLGVYGCSGPFASAVPPVSSDSSNVQGG